MVWYFVVLSVVEVCADYGGVILWPITTVIKVVDCDGMDM